MPCAGRVGRRHRALGTPPRRVHRRSHDRPLPRPSPRARLSPPAPTGSHFAAGLNDPRQQHWRDFAPPALPSSPHLTVTDATAATLLSEIRALRDEVTELRAELRARAVPPTQLRDEWVPSRRAAHLAGYQGKHATSTLQDFIRRHNAEHPHDPVLRNGCRVHLPSLRRALEGPPPKPPPDLTAGSRKTRGNKTRSKRRTIDSLFQQN